MMGKQFSQNRSRDLKVVVKEKKRKPAQSTEGQTAAAALPPSGPNHPESYPDPERSGNAETAHPPPEPLMWFSGILKTLEEKRFKCSVAPLLKDDTAVVTLVRPPFLRLHIWKCDQA